jgi:hypothetical protein
MLNARARRFKRFARLPARASGGEGRRRSGCPRTPADEISPAVRRIMRIRSITTLCLFGLAAVAALIFPLVGLGICICCLIVYRKPDPPGARKQMSQG